MYTTHLCTRKIQTKCLPYKDWTSYEIIPGMQTARQKQHSKMLDPMSGYGASRACDSLTLNSFEKCGYALRREIKLMKEEKDKITQTAANKPSNIRTEKKWHLCGRWLQRAWEKSVLAARNHWFYWVKIRMCWHDVVIRDFHQTTRFCLVLLGTIELQKK